MTQLNRTDAIEFNTVENIELIKAQTQYLRNKIPVYIVNAGTQDLVKIEFLFEAGMFYQRKPLQSITTNAMLESGTGNLTANQIADKVDFYGAFFETHIAQDTASVILYTLNKHVDNILSIVEEVIKGAIFPQEEIDTYLTNKKQIFHVNNQKVANVARKRFTELVFGSKHPYGINLKTENFDSLKIGDLKEFYSQFYASDNCKIIISGKVSDKVISNLDKHFGGNDWAKPIDEQSRIVSREYCKNVEIPIQYTSNKDYEIEIKGAMQSAIRIGKPLFTKTHNDYQSLQVLNTVYGGYFGSRLMSNIREDKGFTYGIGSGIAPLKHSGYFFISTEVGVDVCSKALDEIYFEMNRLREELIPDEELTLVKNFMLGSFLRGSDGPFAMAERFKGVLNYGLDYDYYDQYISTIQSISSSKLRELANQYFDKESMIEVIAGRK